MLCAKVTGFYVIARRGTPKQSHKKRLGLPRRYAPRNDIFYEIATLLSVARNDKAEPFFYVVLASRRFGT
jgi:hypothetical protein